MEGEDKNVLASSQKRPASEDADEEPVRGDESAAKKPKPASSFSELASRAAAKEASATGEAVTFLPASVPARAGLPLGLSKKSDPTTDSDHADSPSSAPISQFARFSNSPSDSRTSPRTAGSFSLAPPTLAAPKKKTESPSEAQDAGATKGSQTEPFKGSQSIKDQGFGFGAAFQKPAQPSVASQNPFLQCLNKKPAAAAATAPSSSEGPSEPEKSDGPPRFVFGQNLTDRAKVPSFSSSATSTNGASTAVPPAESTSAGPVVATAAANSGSSSSINNSVHDLPIVDIVTGEEGETNVLQVSCRLYIFNRETRQWIERGRGILRLNDKTGGDGGPVASRLVVRLTGSFRVMVNCALWAGQSCEKVNMRSARMTVMAGSELEIVLIKAPAVEITDLVSQMNRRIHALKKEKKISTGEPPKFTSGEDIATRKEEQTDSESKAEGENSPSACEDKETEKEAVAEDTPEDAAKASTNDEPAPTKTEDITP